MSPWIFNLRCTRTDKVASPLFSAPGTPDKKKTLSNLYHHVIFNVYQVPVVKNRHILYHICSTKS